MLQIVHSRWHLSRLSSLVGTWVRFPRKISDAWTRGEGSKYVAHSMVIARNLREAWAGTVVEGAPWVL